MNSHSKMASGIDKKRPEYMSYTPNASFVN